MLLRPKVKLFISNKKKKNEKKNSGTSTPDASTPQHTTFEMPTTVCLTNIVIYVLSYISDNRLLTVGSPTEPMQI